MKRAIILAPILLSLAVVSVHSAVQLGWADKFMSGVSACRPTATGYMYCSIYNMWDDDFAWSPPTWEYLGTQGGNAAGRANVVESVLFQFRDADSYTYTASTTLTRYRVTSIPGEGSACNTGSGGTYINSVTQTFTSTGFSGSDWYINNRNLPQMDFSAETTTSGDVGYRSVIAYSADSGGTINSSYENGCYKIAWF